MKQEVSPVQKVLNTWAVVLILWSAYRVYFGTGLPIWFDEFIAKPLIFLVPVYLYITHVEHKSIVKSLDLWTKDTRSGVLFGCVIGGLFLLLGGVVFAFSQAFTTSLFSLQLIGTIVGYVAISFATSFSEELLSRGFVLKRLYEESKHSWMSVLFASFLFFFLHIPMLLTHPDLQGSALLQVMLADILLSLTVSTLYLYKRSVWTPIIIHACYSLSLYLFLRPA